MASAFDSVDSLAFKANSRVLDAASRDPASKFAYPSTASGSVPELLKGDRQEGKKRRKIQCLSIGLTMLSLLGAIISLTILIQTAIETPIAPGAAIALPIFATVLVASSVVTYVSWSKPEVRRTRENEGIGLETNLGKPRLSERGRETRRSEAADGRLRGGSGTSTREGKIRGNIGNTNHKTVEGFISKRGLERTGPVPELALPLRAQNGNTNMRINSDETQKSYSSRIPANIPQNDPRPIIHSRRLQSSLPPIPASPEDSSLRYSHEIGDNDGQIDMQNIHPALRTRELPSPVELPATTHNPRPFQNISNRTFQEPHHKVLTLHLRGDTPRVPPPLKDASHPNPKTSQRPIQLKNQVFPRRHDGVRIGPPPLAPTNEEILPESSSRPEILTTSSFAGPRMQRQVISTTESTHRPTTTTIHRATAPIIEDVEPRFRVTQQPPTPPKTSPVHHSLHPSSINAKHLSNTSTTSRTTTVFPETPYLNIAASFLQPEPTPTSHMLSSPLPSSTVLPPRMGFGIDSQLRSPGGRKEEWDRSPTRLRVRPPLFRSTITFPSAPQAPREVEEMTASGTASNSNMSQLDHNRRRAYTDGSLGYGPTTRAGQWSPLRLPFLGTDDSEESSDKTERARSVQRRSRPATPSSPAPSSRRGIVAWLDRRAQARARAEDSATDIQDLHADTTGASTSNEDTVSSVAPESHEGSESGWRCVIDLESERSKANVEVTGGGDKSQKDRGRRRDGE